MTTPSFETGSLDRQAEMALVADLFRTVTAVDGFTAQLRRAFALNAHERLAVSALWAEGPMSMTELGAWIPLSRAAVTTLVDRLEEAGFVRREADMGDRRRTVVVGSEEALARLLPLVQAWAGDMHELAHSFDEAEWAVIERFMDGLRRSSTNHSARIREMSDEQVQALAAEVAGSTDGGTI
jgi:DNA-binding MarR family transcriptional regulator